MNEFLIQKETLTNIADKFRDYLYEVGDNTHMIDPQFRPTYEDQLAEGAVNFTFYEEFDAAGHPADQGTYPDGSKDGGFLMCDMRRNDKGHLVPVIISEGMHDSQEDQVSAYYYVGIDVIEGVTYDKWRRIEGVDINTGGPPDPDENYTWESSFRSYLYTNRIVVPVGENITQYNPTEFDTKIDDVYKAGAATGTEEGSGLKSYDEGVIDLAPLYIQSEKTEISTGANYKNKKAYNWSWFENVTIGTTTYNINDIISYAVSTNNFKGLQITNNNSLLWATVYVQLRHSWVDFSGAAQTEILYRTASVAPGETTTVSLAGGASNNIYGTIIASYVKWSTTEPVATAEVTE